VYLGSNITTAELEEVVDTVQPQLICSSAATTQAAKALAEFSQEFQANSFTHTHNPIFTFGGTAFNQNSTLIPNVAGLYLGDTIETAVRKIQDLFA
jgi:hypothetical protein